MNDTNVIVETNYEKYKNGDELLNLSIKRKNFIFPEELYVTAAGEYIMEWHIECDKNNVDYPAMIGF